MKNERVIFIVFLCLLLIIPFSSAGFAEWFNKLTGKATDTATFDINMSVGSGSVPTIPIVWNTTMTDISSSGTNEAPSPTYVMINFTASDEDGYENLNESSAVVNFSKASEDTRQNASCVRYGGSGNTANFTCNVTMWWWDATGIWNIQAYIKDLSGNAITNTSSTFYVGATSGVIASPSFINWTQINPSAINVLSNNDPLLLNNTGNQQRNIEINATDLLGETDPGKGIYADNFSVNTVDACEGTAMQANVYTNIPTATLPKGNYTDGSSGKEEIYFCIEAANADLSPQYYSTDARGSWTVQITA